MFYRGGNIKSNFMPFSVDGWDGGGANLYDENVLKQDQRLNNIHMNVWILT